MEQLGERPIWSMSDGELLPVIDQVDAALTRLLTYRLQLIARVDEIGLAKDLGARDTTELLAKRYRIDSRDTHRDVKLARALPKHDIVAAALTDPVEPLHPNQAAAITTALDRVAARVPVEHLDIAEEQLVKLAKNLAPSDLAKTAKDICELLDSDGPEPDENAAYARETLTLTNTNNGVKFRGFLANENAELLRSRILAAARPHKTPNGELDPRPREKRQADALTDTLRIAAAATDATTRTRTNSTPTTTRAGADPAPGASAAPATTASEAGTAPVTTAPEAGAAPTPTAAGADPASETSAAPATAARREAGTTGNQVRAEDTATPTAGRGGGTSGEVVRSASGTGGSQAGGGGSVPGYGSKATITVTIDFDDLKNATANATGHLMYGDDLSAATIRRLACDAKIIPLVLGSNSEPLDVGRAERLVTRAMRFALNTRDKGCVVCGAPPIFCDAHHLKSWIDGGNTAVHNLVLLCRRDHMALHNGHWTITITDGRVEVSRPSWADPPPQQIPSLTDLLKPPRERPSTDAAAHTSTTGTVGMAGMPSVPWLADEPETGEAGKRRAHRWEADEAMREEAARFADWDISPADHGPADHGPADHGPAFQGPPQAEDQEWPWAG
jgi:hypothetical protein